MKLVVACLVSLSSFGAELIYISNDVTNANIHQLSEKYLQPLLIGENNVYIIPKECQLERYFGGSSQGELKLVKMPEMTENIAVTQKVFQAKEEKEIINTVEADKSIAVAEGKVSHDFLEDKEGRSFGGASQVQLDMSTQKKQFITKVSSIPVKETAVISPKILECHLLPDGSGYEIKNGQNLQWYIDSHHIPLDSNIVVFR